MVFGIHLIIGHSRINSIRSAVRTGAGDDTIKITYVSNVASIAANMAAISKIPGNQGNILLPLRLYSMLLKVSDFKSSFIFSLNVFSSRDRSFSLLRRIIDLSSAIFSLTFENSMLLFVAIFSFKKVRTGLFCLIFCKILVPSTGDASTACDKNNAATAMQVIMMILLFIFILTPLIFIF